MQHILYAYSQTRVYAIGTDGYLTMQRKGLVLCIERVQFLVQNPMNTDNEMSSNTLHMNLQWVRLRTWERC